MQDQYVMNENPRFHESIYEKYTAGMDSDLAISPPRFEMDVIFDE